jgi:hypothetical protein
MDDMMLLMNDEGQTKGGAQMTDFFSSSTMLNDLYPTTKGMTNLAVDRRQAASRRVTVRRRDCDCLSCTSAPRSDAALLVENFHYASTPTVTQL